MNENYDYIIYTDGAYSQIHDEGAFAYVMLDGNGNEIRRFVSKISHETNNRAELKAIITAIYHLPLNAKRVKVISDSQYALYTLSGEWSRKTNLELFDVFENVMRAHEGLTIEWEWVRGHNGNKYNEICDQLCNDMLGYDANIEFAKYKKTKRKWNETTY